MTRGSAPICTRRPSVRTSSARKPPSASSRTSASTVNRPALSFEPSKISTSTGPTNEVALDLGVLPGGVGELPGEGVDEIGETVDVGRGQGHREGIGRDEAPHAHPAVQVHLARQPPADLYRLEVASERLGQRTLHQTLEALLELLESHGPRQTNGPVRPIQAYWPA